MPFTRLDRDAARARLREVVDSYAQQREAAEDPAGGYPESQARVDFIDEFLIVLGWDVRNEGGRPHSLREVVVELSTGLDDAGEPGSGRPDYVLRVDGKPRLVVEAKKPAVNVPNSANAARQARRYGHSMALPAAVLTNFTSTAIYDARVEPQPGDDAHVARLPEGLIDWRDYADRFDDLWERLSYEVVASEQYFDVYDYEVEPRGTAQVDRALLAQLRQWRIALASDISQSDSALGPEEVGRLTQRLLNALLFLRICEDREIEPYGSLSDALESGRFEDRLRSADDTYNAGLFEVLDRVSVSDAVLQSVIEDLYWPRSRYAFAVLEPEILAAVYEHFLGERLAPGFDGFELEPKPELLHHGGVVPTPDWVIERVVDLALEGVSPQPINTQASAPTVLDPASGSGGFLLAVYRRLLRQMEPAGERLDLSSRGELASRHLFGVDIDPEAVEVTRLSLLLAILGDERIDPRRARDVLPDLRANIRVGNTLIDSSFDEHFPSVAANIDRRAAVRPFDWDNAFPKILEEGEGFDVVLGNPPYARIQVLAEHLPDQRAFFQSPASGYATAQEFNFDQYMLFVERGLQLLRPGGRLTYILPHRFMTSVAGSAMRRRLLQDTVIEKVIHFGHAQIFPGRSTYTCLLRVRKAEG